MKATHDDRRHMLVLARGEDVFVAITNYCKENNISAGVFQAIGAVERVSIGYYDVSKREYFFREEVGEFEVSSMNGNVTILDGAPFVHAHAVLSRCDETGATIGGHLKQAHVAVTLEVFLIALDVPLVRAHDEAIGLNLITV